MSNALASGGAVRSRGCVDMGKIARVAWQQRLRRTTGEERLAINGGRAAVCGFQGKAKPKIGLDEFVALARLWGYSAASCRKIRRLLAAEARHLPAPHLARYYNPRPSQVAALENYAKRLFGTKFALAVNSGTSALMCAYAAVGIGPGDEVIIPGYTFFATAAAVLASRAIPVIAEVDDSLTIDPRDVERKITSRTKAIVAVHMCGYACDLDRLLALARRRRLALIEDNAQACGGRYRGRFLGTFGAMGCFSLSAFKIIGAGEAGLVLTDDEYLHMRAQNQHDTAACWRPDRYAQERRPGELFAGQNYRMSELEGAVNLVQLKKADAVARRYRTVHRRICRQLDESARRRLRRSNDPEGDVGYMLNLFGRTREEAQMLIAALRAEGLPASGRGVQQCRDWHIYAYWEHVMEQKTVTAEGCPFTCPYYRGPRPAYRPDMCPRTLDQLARAVFIRIDAGWNAEDCRQAAKAINKVCRAHES